MMLDDDLRASTPHRFEPRTDDDGRRSATCAVCSRLGTDGIHSQPEGDTIAERHGPFGQ